MRIGFLGPRATFTEIAARSLFPGEDLQPFQSIPDCMDAVSDGSVDIGIVPLENAIEGSVNITLDYLIHETDLPIAGEMTLPIRQHLMVHSQNRGKKREITQIFSHPHALAQCHKFLHTSFNGVMLESSASTAAAAKKVKENPDLVIAAIANELAAEEYGLDIVAENIHDYEFNHTRFVVLTRHGEAKLKVNRGFEGFKTKIMVTLPSDQAGALHQVLAAFAWRKLNLSKIESRPMKTGIGNYFFIIDIEMKIDEVLIPGAIAELEALGCLIKVLGSYPSYRN
ncbi:prephenate dehydratase [Neobacillus terrae]|uniref:prephenate dehydratase n=1 Tax=Neobacillus terrae TaxID=3034837 RepID=UPI00140DE01C|nr:prephenate dehydratase [Neobacillus terrae]